MSTGYIRRPFPIRPTIMHLHYSFSHKAADGQAVLCDCEFFGLLFVRVFGNFTCRNCGGGDRGRVAIYPPFGEFRRAKSYCHLYGAQGQRRRTSCPCHDEFRGPRSDYVDRWHQKTITT
ncbi:hypothetical protein TNCV_3548331 [Trichonephila clavipes]|nr:hypothetical protein TNCV_3548331 [Trichonephila clavipes]